MLKVLRQLFLWGDYRSSVMGAFVFLYLLFFLPVIVFSDGEDPVYSTKSAGRMNFGDDITPDDYQNLLEGKGAIIRAPSVFGDVRVRYRNVAGTQNEYSRVPTPIKGQYKPIPPATRTGLTFGQIAKEIKKSSSQESDFPLTFKELSKRLKTSTSNAVIRAR